MIALGPWYHNVICRWWFGMHSRASPLALAVSEVSSHCLSFIFVASQLIWIHYRCECIGCICSWMILIRRLPVILAGRISLLISDILVLVVTWRVTWSTFVYARKVKLSTAPSLSSLLLRDGASLYQLPYHTYNAWLYRYNLFPVSMSC